MAISCCLLIKLCVLGSFSTFIRTFINNCTSRVRRSETFRCLSAVVLTCQNKKHLSDTCCTHTDNNMRLSSYCYTETGEVVVMFLCLCVTYMFSLSGLQGLGRVVVELGSTKSDPIFGPRCHLEVHVKVVTHPTPVNEKPFTL